MTIAMPVAADQAPPPSGPRPNGPTSVESETTREWRAAWQREMEAAQAGAVSRSLEACKLGSGKAAVDALRARLVASAEADGDGEYLVANAPARARQIAKSECVLKGEMWGGRQKKWDTFCDSNFAAEARGER